MTRRVVAARAALVGLVALGGIGVASAHRLSTGGVESGVGSVGAIGTDPATLAADTPPVLAPPVEAAAWLNTAPLGAADLAGKVVLYDFWTFGCVNCQHTLPAVEAWHRRYAADGLVVVSIHTPEFPHEADPAAVAAFAEEHGLTYPVALDPQRRTWRAFDNHVWPAFYLHDRAGARRLVRFGEGRDREIEDALRVLLGVDPDAPRATIERAGTP